MSRCQGAVADERPAWGRRKTKQWEKDALQLVLDLKKRMIERHNIGLGVFGLPEGVQPTWTRADFLKQAESKGEVDQREKALLLRYWRGILWRALDD